MSQWWAVVAVLIYLGFVAAIAGLAPLAAREMLARRRRPSWFDAAYIGAGTLFIVLSRLPILELSRDLQPDEAQYGANAIMAASGWLNWDSIDSGSSGPLQSMLQAWPLLFGWDITFTTIHITGAVLACLMSALVYLILSRALGTLYGVIFTVPTTLFLGATSYWDLVHSTSLYGPITLSLFGAYAAVSVWRRPNLPLALAGAFALGLIPLIKPHGALLGGYVGLALLWAHIRLRPSWRAKALGVLPLVVAAVFPLGLSVGALLLNGHLGDFLLEALGYSAGYVARPPSPLYWLRAIFDVPHLAVMVMLFGLVIAAAGLQWRKRWCETEIFTWFAFGLLAMAGLSIIAPGQGHHHYLLYIVPTLPILAAALTREALLRPAGGMAQMTAMRAVVVTAAIALIMLPTALWSARKNPALDHDGVMIANGLRVHGPHLLHVFMPQTDARLIVFGYEPAFYVDANLPSGTRETWSENVLDARASRAQYRRRFITEMDTHRPAMFIDAVAPGDFIYRDDATQGPRTIPGLGERLDRDYEVVSRSSPATGCSELYMRRDLAAQLPSRLAEVSQVRASGFLADASGAYQPDRVVDRHLFETCVDRWLAPSGAPAWIDLTLAQPNPILRVSLLNTRGTWRPVPPGEGTNYRAIFGNVSAYHAARTAIVKLMQGDRLIAEKRVAVDGYPYWTDVDFETGAAVAVTHVRIEFPDWHGAGPGLNEVVLVPAKTAKTLLSGH